MKGWNGKLQRLESALSIFDPEPVYSSDQLRTWQTAVEFSDLVYSQYGGDRQLALASFDEFPPDLRVKLSAFDWSLMAFLGPLVSDEAKAVKNFRDEFLWAVSAVVDEALKCGGTVAELSRPEALAEAVQTIDEFLIEWQEVGA